MMKKLLFLMVIMMIAIMALPTFASASKEELIQMIQKKEEEIKNIKGFGTITPTDDLPSDKDELDRLFYNLQVQLSICKGDERWDRLQLFLGDYKIRIQDITNTKQPDGRTILTIKMTFYNNSSESTSYNSALRREIYQDGYELDDYISGDKDTMTKIRPSMKIDVTECFVCRDLNGKGIIEMDVHPFLDSDKTHAYSGVIYKLK